MATELMQQWLADAAQYFATRPTLGEDMAHWANVYNAENCRTIATLLASQEAEIAELLVALAGAERKIVSLYRSINPHGNDDNGGTGDRFADKDEDVIAIRALRPAETGEPTND